MNKVIKLDDNEERVLIQLLNTALKSLGIEAIDAVNHFLQKIKNAPEDAKVEVDNSNI
jgi:hypothetical protein